VKANGTPLIDRGLLLRQAQLLIQSDNFDHEANARANALMTLAQRLESNGKGHGSASQDDPEMRDFEKALRDSRQDGRFHTRDMNVGAGGAGGYLVPVGFADRLQAAMAAVDALFSPDVTNVFESANGNVFNIPAVSDETASAEVVAEAGPDTTLDPTILQTQLPQCPTYRSHGVRVSVELAQDSYFDLTTFLEKAFAARLARRIGADLTSSLLAAAQVGATAVGSSGNTGGTETGGTSIGSDDLHNLMDSLDPAYLNGKTRWFVSWPVLIGLWKLKDRQGRPVFRPEFSESGRPVLLGFEVGVCPSFPSLGLGNKCVAFGDGDYFAVRVVKNSVAIAKFVERFAEFGIIYFKALMRVNGTLVCAGATSTPIKVLQCAAS
jgi:HK97 family phage major capsid protein